MNIKPGKPLHPILSVVCSNGQCFVQVMEKLIEEMNPLLTLKGKGHSTIRISIKKIDELVS